MARSLSEKIALERQAKLPENSGQNLLRQLVSFHAVSKAQDGRLISQAGELLELGKRAMRRGVEERFFHTGGRAREPSLHEAAAQHRRQMKGGLPMRCTGWYGEISLISAAMAAIDLFSPKTLAFGSSSR